MTESLKKLLQAIADGAIDPETALDKLKDLPFESLDEFAKIDRHRQLRTGFPEVIWGADKTPEQIIKIINLMKADEGVVMATRISPEIYEQLKNSIPDLVYYNSARICALLPAKIPQKAGTISILTAGTADIPVAEEAAVTGELCGFGVKRLWDVGVAGIHRLLSNRQVIYDADVLIVAAGM
ncbi:MAG: 1-(5-phosphoribosyl)-5-amino-4-imidazole-carboxylate carboxylase, partial [Cyanobacteria bacterium P01_G01_bin.19]